MPPPTVSKSLGRGSGKDGRHLVSDLAQARANEALLRQQLTEERQKHDAFRQEETRRTAKIKKKGARILAPSPTNTRPVYLRE